MIAETSGPVIEAPLQSQIWTVSISADTPCLRFGDIAFKNTGPLISDPSFAIEAFEMKISASMKKGKENENKSYRAVVPHVQRPAIPLKCQ